jgi:sugar phosphate isomerase/epimerase
MKFGICTTIENSPAVQAAGWDFIEERVDQLLQGLLPMNEWKGGDRAKNSALPIPAANVLVPALLKITGPDANLDKLRDYMTTVISRAKEIGIRTLVFGSGGARNVPDGFDRHRAQIQIIDFLKLVAPIAQAQGITIVIEPLNKKECNILNSVPEAMVYVRELNHPNIRCLVDSYHFWLENDSLAELARWMPSIAHVHVADKDGRTAPGQSGTSDYQPFFSVLKKAGYDGLISVEAGNFIDAPNSYAGVLEYLKDQWKSC